MIHLILTAALTLLFAPGFGGASVPNDGLSVRDTIAVEELPWQNIGRGAQAVSFRINLFNAPQTISFPQSRRSSRMFGPNVMSESSHSTCVNPSLIA